MKKTTKTKQNQHHQQLNQDLMEAKRVLRIESQCILAAVQKLTLDFSKAVQCIVDAVRKKGKVIILGVGKSGKIGAKISATLSSLGIPSIFLHPTEASHGDLGLVQNHDVLLILSYSGSTFEVLSLMPSLKKRKIKIISILGNLNSELAQVSDYVLDGSVSQEACPMNLAPTSSTTVALALGDALSSALSKRFQIQEENFAQNHPGGHLGRRLALKVQDLMQPRQTLTWVHENDSLEQVVSVLNENRLGAVLVRNSKKQWQGLITDGDIRRATSLWKQKFFLLKAKDIMTQNPIVVHAQEKALDALARMENRKNQINVLPVLNEKDQCIGLIRLHDLLGRV